jgi:mannose-6-phosphate isomerase-like protein (cupin superfamily)
MSYLRRDFTFLLPALVGMQAAAQTAAPGVLPSKCYSFEDLPVKTNPVEHSESRQVFRGETHDGFLIASHMTTLAPGHAPHPPHKHVNEEMFFIREGTLEVTIEGVSCQIGPGSVAYVHSNEMHGVKNVGAAPAQYFVLELDGQRS